MKLNEIFSNFEQDPEYDPDKKRHRANKERNEYRASRNYVSKHDHNKGGAHADKKNDYKRSPKHKSNDVEEAITVNDTAKDVQAKIKDMQAMKMEFWKSGDKTMVHHITGVLAGLKQKLVDMGAATESVSESAKPKKRKVKTKAKKK